MSFWSWSVWCASAAVRDCTIVRQRRKVRGHVGMYTFKRVRVTRIKG